jgi:hypothetical protein
MAISETYYLNGPSLGSSTTIYSNSSLTTIAPDGFYSDGVTSREQVSGVLLPAVTCGSCATPCGGNINGSGNQGIYLLNLDAGNTVSDVGAIIVRFDPFGVPDGIRATYNGNVYNRLSSPVNGFHSSSNPSGFTIIGNSTTTGNCSSSWYPSGGNLVLNEFLYSGNSFSPTGNTQTIAISSGDLSLRTVNPNNCIMVIPKVNSSPSIVNFELIGPCGGTVFNVNVSCPALLTGFDSSIKASTSSGACFLSETVTYYNASLANTPGTVGMYDFVFSDPYGASILQAGFYKASGSITGSNDWFQVDVNGVVVSMGACSSTSNYTFNWTSAGYINSIDSCSTPLISTFTAYSSSPTLSIGVLLYTSPSLISPVIGGNSWFKNGANTYQINNSGQIVNIITCSTPAFSATMTVGAANQFGYRQGIYGSISATNISNPAGANAVLTDLYWSSGGLRFFIANGSSTVPPNGWTTLVIGGNQYDRTSFTVIYDNTINKWTYSLSSSDNPFGTVVGNTRAITLT